MGQCGISFKGPLKKELFFKIKFGGDFDVGLPEGRSPAWHEIYEITQSNSGDSKGSFGFWSTSYSDGFLRQTLARRPGKNAAVCTWNGGKSLSTSLNPRTGARGGACQGQ